MACRSKGMVNREPGKAQGMRTCRMPCCGTGDPGRSGVQPGQAVAMIEVPPASGREVIIERGPGATFRTSEGGVASMCEPKIDLVLLRVESNVLDPPGVLESQESGEESDVTHGRDLVEGDGYRTSAHTVVFCGGTEKREGGGGFGGRELGPAGPAPREPPTTENAVAFPQALNTNGSDHWIFTHTKPGRTRIPLPGGLGYAGVPHGVEGEAGRQGLDPAQASLGLAGLELLHLAPSSSSRLLK